MFVNGVRGESYYENPFIRWHESYEKYPSFLADMDDVALY